MRGTTVSVVSLWLWVEKLSQVTSPLSYWRGLLVQTRLAGDLKQIGPFHVRFFRWPLAIHPFVLEVRRGLPSDSATELNRKGLIIMPPSRFSDPFLQTRSCRAQYREGGREADREKDGRTTSQSGQAWRWATPWETRRIERDGGNWLPGHLLCPHGQPDYGICKCKCKIHITMASK